MEGARETTQDEWTRLPSRWPVPWVEGGVYEEINRLQGGPVTGGGFRRYGLKVRPGFVPKVLTSDPVNGE